MTRPVNQSALSAEIAKTIFTPSQFARFFGPVTPANRRQAYDLILGLQHLAKEYQGPEHHIWKIRS